MEQENSILNEFTIRVGKNGYLVYPNSHEGLIANAEPYGFYVFESTTSLEFFLKTHLIKPEFDFKLAMGKAIGNSETH